MPIRRFVIPTAFIPAKGTSLGIPSKNLQPVGGVSLVKRTYEFAKDAAPIDRIVISTDSYEVLAECVPGRLSKSEFLNLPHGSVTHINQETYLHVRREQDADPRSKTITSVLDFLGAVQKETNWSNQLLLLQPTSPFRSTNELKQIVDTYVDNHYVSVVSGKLSESPHPEKSFEIYPDSRIRVTSEILEKLESPRQALKQLYVFDGAYYLTAVDHIQKNKSLISEQTQLFNRSGWKTLNIDNREDLELANYLAEKLKI